MLPQVPDGYDVHYEHERFEPRLIEGRTLNREVHGRTTAFVQKDDGDVVAEGVAWCGIHDQFNRRLGRTIALGRALKKMEEK